MHYYISNIQCESFYSRRFKYMDCLKDLWYCLLKFDSCRTMLRTGTHHLNIKPWLMSYIMSRILKYVYVSIYSRALLHTRINWDYGIDKSCHAKCSLRRYASIHSASEYILCTRTLAKNKLITTSLCLRVLSPYMITTSPARRNPCLYRSRLCARLIWHD